MSPAAGRLRWGSLGVMLAVIGVRVLSEHARIPWWDFDPLVSPIPETRITPAMALVMDAILVIASIGVVIAEWLAGRRIGVLGGVLVVIGAAGVALHGFVLTPYGGVDTLHGDARSLSIGASWAAAVTAGWSLSMGARDRSTMRVCAGVVLGIAVPLAAIGAVQVFVEHAQMVRVFDADPEGSLAAAGLAPGSAGAAAFERRLRQAEATGPFGLANVFGTVVAAGAVFWGIVALGGVRERSRGALAIALAGFGAAGAGLWLSASKGAMVAAVCAGVFVGAARLAPKGMRDRRWIGVLLGVGLIGVPLGAVAARGVIGERIGELSLLFRAQYAEAAGRIVAKEPVFGVGPGNFKSAYLIAKNPLNPEQVESPHSVMLDWVSTLGLFGAAWSVVLVLASGAIGAGVWSHSHAGPSEPARAEEVPRVARFTALLVPIGAGAIAMLIAGGSVSPERAVALLVSIGAWALMSCWCAGAVRLTLWMALGAAGAAAVAVAHGMIEVTPVMPGSVAWWAAVVGLAVGAFGPSSPRERLTKNVGWCVACACLAVWAGMVGVRAARVFGWEAQLRDAWIVASGLAAQDSAERVPEVGKRLALAWMAEPGFIQIGQEAVRVQNQAGSMAEWSEAEQTASRMAGLFPGRVEAWVAKANALRTPPPTAWEALVEAAKLDPWSLGIAVRLAELTHQWGFADSGPKWARRALEIDELLRLDPLVRLSPEARARVEEWAGGSEKGHPGGEP